MYPDPYPWGLRHLKKAHVIEFLISCLVEWSEVNPTEWCHHSVMTEESKLAELRPTWLRQTLAMVTVGSLLKSFLHKFYASIGKCES